MRTSVRFFLAALLLVGSVGALPPAPVRAQEEEPDQAELERLNGPYQEAQEALQGKEYEKAIKAYDKLFARLEKAQLADKFKKQVEKEAKYNYACCLSLTGKKPEAIKAFARAVELGFWDWKHIEKDTDLDPIRQEEDFKKAIETGKGLEKAQIEKDSNAAAEETKKALAGKPLFDFDFTVKTLDGKTVKLSDLKGKVVIVDVWGTWCPPCRAEIPHFVKLYDTYKEKGLEIVGLAVEQEQEEAPATVKAFAEKNGMKYLLAAIEQESDPIKQIPDFKAFPTTIFVDRDGKVRVKEVGYRDYGVLDGTTRALLDAKAADKK